MIDSDIQEISEQIHRLLLQVRRHTRTQVDYLRRRCLLLPFTIYFLLSLSTIWAPAAMVAMEAMVLMSSR